MRIEDIPAEDMSEQVREVRRKHTNILARLLEGSGIDRRRIEVSTRNGVVVSYRTHDGKSPAFGLINALYPSPRLVVTRDALNSFQSPGRLQVSTLTSDGFTNPDTIEPQDYGEVYKHFVHWISRIQHYESLLAKVERLRREEEEAPDLWTSLLSPPAYVSVPTADRSEATFTEEEVRDVRQRVLAAVESIPTTSDFTESMRQVIREELEAHLPRAGQRWSMWRDGFVGWGMGKVLDGMLSLPALQAIVHSVWHYVTSHLAPTLPPMLGP